MRVVKIKGIPRVMSDKKWSLDIQWMAMLMVIPKTTLVHSGQTLV